MQRRQRQSTPGCAQDREPGNAVGQVQQRTRQGEQVADDRDFRKWLDLAGGHGEPAFHQARGNAGQVRAAAHEDPNTRFRRGGADIGNDLENAGRLRLTVIFLEWVEFKGTPRFRGDRPLPDEGDLACLEEFERER